MAGSGQNYCEQRDDVKILVCDGTVQQMPSQGVVLEEGDRAGSKDWCRKTLEGE